MAEDLRAKRGGNVELTDQTVDLFGIFSGRAVVKLCPDEIGDDLDGRKGWDYVAKIVYGALGRKPQPGDE